MPNFHQKNLIQMHKFHLIRSPCNLPTQFPHSLFLIDTVGFEPITSLPNNSSLSSQNKCRQKSSPQLTFDLRYVNPNSISTFPFLIDTVKFEPIASLPNNYSLSSSQNMHRKKSNPQVTYDFSLIIKLRYMNPQLTYGITQ